MNTHHWVDRKIQQQIQLIRQHNQFYKIYERLWYTEYVMLENNSIISHIQYITISRLTNIKEKESTQQKHKYPEDQWLLQ